MMYACPLDHPALPTLFDPAVPNNPALWAVLKGRHMGKAVVDDVLRPSQCVLRTDAVLTYFGRHTSQAFLDDAVAHFRQTGDVWLVWPPNLPFQPSTSKGVQVIARIEFNEYDPGSLVLAEWRQRLPEGFEIHPMNRQLLERCEWRDEMSFYCGSLDNFLVNGIGLCLMQGEDIIVEAYASALGEMKAEIGALTRERYRGLGYAPIACAYLIAACQRRGYQATWSCDAENQASIRVARKLGFQQERAYQILEYNISTSPQ